MRPPRPTSARHRALVVAGAALCGLGLAACTGSDQAGHPSPSSTTARPPGTGAQTGQRAEHIDGETVTSPPKLASGKPLAQVASASGNRQIELGKVAAGPLSVMVNCRGKGTLTVTVQPTNLSFPLQCVAQEVSSTYNELQLSHARSNATVSVTAPSSITWSLTAGQ